MRVTNALTILPAVDVQSAQAVQLVQGVAGTEKVFGDPHQAAKRWAEQGASWLHLVDLDAAFGRGSNADLLADVIAGTDLNVELSGGIRDDASLSRALATGCRRVNIGTAALEDPQWCERVIGQYGDRIAIGLDVKGTKLAARGWTREGGDLFETIATMDKAGCQRYVVTDVASDGMLTGPNVELLKQVCAHTDAAVVASGGVGSLADVTTLRALVPDGVEGVIIGTALYLGKVKLPEALAAAR